MKTRSTVNRILVFLGLIIVTGSALVLSTDSNRGNKVSASCT